MLITRPKNLCLKKYLNIFYKYEHYVLTMGSGGNYNGTTRIEINDLEDEYVKYLQDLKVYGNRRRPERYTFLNLTTSLLEVLIKNEIINGIKGNREFYRKYWRMMLINGKPVYRFLKSNFDSNYPIEKAIPKFFTYQSFYPISLIADSFSCVENFMEKEFPKSKKFKNRLELFLDGRNDSTHNLKDSVDMNVIDEIREDLPNFIKNIKKIISTSLEYRNSMGKKSSNEDDLRILEAQKKWLDKVNEAIKHRGRLCDKCDICKLKNLDCKAMNDDDEEECGKCDICKSKKQNCEKRILPSKLWSSMDSTRNIVFDDKFLDNFHQLRSLLK